MSLKKLLVVFSLCLFYLTVFAQNASIFKNDYEPITPQTWQEVDLTYTNNIDGQEYTEHANLLRPTIWIKHNHLDKVGTTIHLTKEQLGIDIDAKVAAIKPVKLNYSNNNHKDTKPVIATFITHSDDVWDYTFKDEHDHIKVIHAVSNHPFYSLDRHSFVPIKQFNIGEQVKADNNLVYLTSKQKNNKQIEIIYNVEVYQRHNYMVGNNEILVHNPYDSEFREMLFNNTEFSHAFNSGGGCFLLAGCTVGYYGFNIKPEEFISNFAQQRGFFARGLNRLSPGTDFMPKKRFFEDIGMPIQEEKTYTTYLGFLSRGRAGPMTKLDDNLLKKIVAPLFGNLEDSPKAVLVGLSGHVLGFVEHENKYLLISDEVPSARISEPIDFSKVGVGDLDSALWRMTNNDYKGMVLRRVKYFKRRGCSRP